MQPKNASLIKETLKQHHLFSKLTELQLDRVYQNSQVIRLSDGEILFNQREQVRSFYMVLRGGIKLFIMSADGQEKIIEIVKPGQVFAEALMFADQADYPVSSAALSDTEVLSINAKNFKNMLWDSTDTCLQLLAAMSLRLRSLVNEIDKLTLHSGTCRVASYLVQEMPEGEKEFKLDIAKNIIAARLSIKPETFSRIIKNLKEQGILSIDGNSVIIHDTEKLKQQSLL
ncbi:MAG: Crp/Fnr family transcriptional regulator [Gammaproteobacteria bacterium]|jgi:CRP-like cAMP-binding protein|nr:Crp/Fnr family transcriptional regulator [Gammaproteobacteria bacterium]